MSKISDDQILLLHGKGISNQAIADELGVARSTISVRVKKLGLSSNKDNQDLFRRNKDKMIELHSQGKDFVQIALHLGVARSTVFKWAKRLNISSNKSSHKTKNNIRLTGKAHEAFLGHLLGDGGLTRNTPTATASGKMEQSLKQGEYFMDKYELFEPISTYFENIKLTRRKTTFPNCEKIYNSRSLFAYMPANIYLDEIYDKLYVGNSTTNHHKKKEITLEYLEEFTDVSLAYMFMDDGFKQHQTYTICTECYSKQSQILFCHFLKEKFDIEATLTPRKNSYRVRVLNKSASKFGQTIAPHIVESMQYKLHKADVLVKEDELLGNHESDNQQPTASDSEGSTTTASSPTANAVGMI